jgi:hypothetical protein
VITISAITGTSGTYIRGVNALALFVALRFELYQNNNLIETTYPENVFQDTRYFSSSDKYLCIF